MQVHPLGARSDNWMYLVVDEASNEAAVVDPYDWKEMLQLVEEKGVNVSFGQSKCLGWLMDTGPCRSQPSSPPITMMTIAVETSNS
jgi:hypothetical protein